MDVTMLTGARPGADGARAPHTRQDGGAFDAFLSPAMQSEAAPRQGERPDARSPTDRAAVEAERARQQERRDLDQRRADTRRAEQRRAEQRRAEHRQAERRDADRRADARRVEERADARRAEERADARQADRAEQRRADDARDAGEADAASRATTPDEAERPSTSRDDGTEGTRSAQGERAREARPQHAAEPTQQPVRSGVDESTAGALGLTGLAQWLEPAADGDGSSRTAIRPDLHAVDVDADAPDLDGPALEMPIRMDGSDDGPDDMLSRLLKNERPSDALARALGGRQGVDSVRLAPRSGGEGELGARAIGPVGLPAAGTARVGEVVVTRPGATPTALPEGVDESSIMRQISDALRLGEGRKGRPQTADIQLHPAELGRVRIRIQMEAGAARVFVTAEHAAVTDMLGAQLDQLRRDLMAQGVQVSHLEVQSELAGNDGEQREAPEHEDGEELEAPVEVDRPRTRRRARGRIDLKA